MKNLEFQLKFAQVELVIKRRTLKYKTLFQMLLNIFSEKISTSIFSKFKLL